jgi:actin-related protein
MTKAKKESASAKQQTVKKTTTIKRKPTASPNPKLARAPARAPLQAPLQAAPTQHPSQTLIVDDGGDTLKYGWTTDSEPRRLPNVTARLRQQWTVLAGDQLSAIQNPNQLIGVTRSTERGVIVNLGNQIQVWKRMLDLLGVAVPLTTDTAQVFGWKQVRGNATETNKAEKAKIPASICAVLLTVPPHCPRTIIDQIKLTWLEDFGFLQVDVYTAQVAATYARPPSPIAAACIVDMGWSACTIVPTYRHNVVDARAIRRLPLGGRHLM